MGVREDKLGGTDLLGLSMHAYVYFGRSQISRENFVKNKSFRKVAYRLLWVFVRVTYMRSYKVGCLWYLHKLLIPRYD